MADTAPTVKDDSAPSEKASYQERTLSEQERAASDEETEETTRMTLNGWLGLGTLVFVYNAYLFTLLMPSTLLAYINADLGPDPNFIWITIGWNLTAAVLVTISGRLADIFGRRWFMITGASLSTIGAIVGVTGHSINQMIASGVLFGLGGGIQEMAFSCLQELVPNNKRFLALGIYEFGNLPSTFAPLMSYAIIAHSATSWRSTYYFCIAWEGMAAILLFLCYHPPSFQTKHRADGETWYSLLTELDYVGLLTFTAAAVLLLLAISWGGTLHPWKSAIVIAPIVVSGCLFIFLGFWEAYATLKYPILPARLFRRTREFTTVLFVSFVAGMLYYSNMTLWPRVSAILFLRADDAIIRGVYANITTFCTTIAAFYMMFIMHRIGHERWQLVGMQVVQTIFVGAMAAIDLHAKARSIVFTMFAGSAAVTTSLATVGTIGLFLDDQADIGVAVGLTCTARLIGGAIANTIYTTIYSNKYKTEIPGQLHRYADAANFTGPFDKLLAATAKNTPAAYAAVPGITDAVVQAAELAVKMAYVPAFRLVYLVSIAFGAVSIACALATRSIPKDKKTKTRAVTMENEKGVHGVAERAAH